MKTIREPKVLIIRLLEACNAGCFMCDFAFSNDTFRFSEDDARKLSLEIINTSIAMVRFTGGEPLLIQNIENIISIFSQIGIHTSIITNGYYLYNKSENLRDANLSQVIISLDGSNSKTHDQFRKTPGLFENIIKGIRFLKKIYPAIIIRVNSVIGAHNIKQIKEIYSLLADLQVEQWSIIPLKAANKARSHNDKDLFRKMIEDFQLYVQNHEGPKLLGYSLHWAGRTESEFSDFWDNLKIITPQKKCELVDLVRYYTPKDNLVFPCNCVPHRNHDVFLGEVKNVQSFSNRGLLDSRNWLRENGSKYCTGCEPINAALGDNSIDLDANIFDF